MQSLATRPATHVCASARPRPAMLPSARVNPRQALLVSRASTDGGAPAAEPARHMALPGGALWLLSYLQDQFYDIRGPQFVITRSEASGTAFKKVRSKTLVHPNPNPGSESSSTGLIHQASRTFPWQYTQLLEGGTIDISDYLDPWSEDEDVLGTQVSGHQVQANTTCTGIVRVESDVSEDGTEEEVDVFYTNSTSPRRTKMIGFTCKCCGARNYNSINPRSFLEGTLVAQCAKCERWHKLSDHFNLFHNLQGPLLRGRPAVSEEDIPPSLRLDPMYWTDFDGSFGLDDGIDLV